jgi:2-iminobutanoate/2-iminopropanoate deaminase
VKVGDLVYTAGCVPLDPATGKFVEGDIEAQATQSLKNLKAIVQASGSELGKVVKTTVRSNPVVACTATNVASGVPQVHG